MVAVMLMSVALVAVLCVVAYKLAVYALPFMLKRCHVGCMIHS